MTPLAAAVLAVYAGPGMTQGEPASAATTPPIESSSATGERAVALPAVRVIDQTEGSYKADTVSSPKFTQPLVNTPQTITVIKKELIADQGAVSLSDALRNVPGITFQLGENGNTQSGDSIFMRGFDSQGSIFLDNVRDLGAAVRDVFNIEQIEIVKGPAGADNGRGAASGYVNLVSKVPVAENADSGSISYGSEARRRVTADLNQTIGEHSAVRLNLVGQDGGVAGRDLIQREQWGIAPSIAFGLGTNTRIYAFSQHIRQDNVPDGGIAAIGLDGYRNPTLDAAGVTAETVDEKNFYGLDADYEDLTANMFTLRIEHDLRPGFTFRNLSRYGKSEQKRVLTAPLQAPNLTYDDDGDAATPAVLQPDSSQWTVNRSRQGSFRENQILTNQTGFTAELPTGPVSHTLSGGVEFLYESQDTPSYGLVTGQTQTPANLYNPNPSDPAADVAPTGAYADGHTTTGAVYLFDTVKLTEQWQLNGGLRWERYETKTDSVSLATATSNPSLPVGTLVPAHLEAADNLLSWKTGVVFKPLANGSVYVAYANSLRPPGGDNFTLSATAANVNSPALEPQKARNLEFGTKWDFLAGRLSATAALFKSTNQNDLARQGEDTVVQYGEKQVKGVELGLVGQLTTAWQISAGYTFQDTEVTAGTIATDGSSTQTGAAINFSPKNSATLWTTYDFPIGLQIGGGVRYVDSQARTVNNSPGTLTAGVFDIGSYTVFDAMAKYELTRNLGVQLNVYNLADEDYVASVNNSGLRYYPGTPRSYLATLNVRF
ncbi:MAG: catecholate siderophore receptor Fiu [Hydrocarboniphaga sp.]|uniref:catecholate siderophore receptor Fiu n=1 Tax=Hydrocarboniphaga sp. TaxID=2033016 RepID=UPI00261503C5|nr:catecholate siderophore receptor Fiu [Hydrocarboniphaga sp.]MDB5967611.1 catecholate siderophore receptor Fiu [Hydrocarboniphaga sp.]